MLHVCAILAVLIHCNIQIQSSEFLRHLFGQSTRLATGLPLWGALNHSLVAQGGGSRPVGTGNRTTRLICPIVCVVDSFGDMTNRVFQGD